MTVQGDMVTGTVLAATEFRDFLCARYDFTPPNLQNECYRCSLSFFVSHGLSCSNEALVIARPDEVRYEILYLT